MSHLKAYLLIVTNLNRLSLRRSALRILTSSPSSFAYKPRTITSLTSSALARSKPATQSLYHQRRWATTGADAEKAAEAEAPISELQPTPEEEVENAIQTEATEAAAPAAGSAATAEPIAVQRDTRRTGREHLGTTDERSHRISEAKPTIYLGNLFFDVTEDDLSRELARFGTIRKCRLMRDSRGLSKG